MKKVMLAFLLNGIICSAVFAVGDTVEDVDRAIKELENTLKIEKFDPHILNPILHPSQQSCRGLPVEELGEDGRICDIIMRLYSVNTRERNQAYDSNIKIPVTTALVVAAKFSLKSKDTASYGKFFQPFKRLELLDASLERKENQLFDVALREVFGTGALFNLRSY